MSVYVALTCIECGRTYHRPLNEVTRPLTCGPNCGRELQARETRKFWEEIHEIQRERRSA